MIEGVQPLVVAHRGSSARHAEHTLDAYLAAIDEGADGLECDVHLSRDGHLVCIHDRRLERTSTGRGLVSQHTLAELETLDYASWRTDLKPAANPSLLTLESLLGLAKDTERTLFIETKHPVRFGPLVEAKLIETLQRHGLAKPPDKATSPVVLMSFSGAAMRRVRELAPRLPTVRLTATRPPMRPPREYPADIIGPGIAWLRTDPGYVERTSLPTYCWTVDAPADILLCRRAGVRYLATNDPAGTRRILAEG